MIPRCHGATTSAEVFKNNRCQATVKTEHTFPSSLEWAFTPALDTLSQGSIPSIPGSLSNKGDDTIVRLGTQVLG